MKQALQQGFTRRSRWLLQILGLTFENVSYTKIILKPTVNYVRDCRKSPHLHFYEF